MTDRKVTVYIQTADRTRKAQITIPRTMKVADIIRASTKRWFMSSRVDYQVANTSTGRLLLSNEMLSHDSVQNGDVLMIQPFPTHGCVALSR